MSRYTVQADDPDPTPACAQDGVTIAYLHDRLDRLETELLILLAERDAAARERDEWKDRRDRAVEECRLLRQEGMSRRDHHLRHCGAARAAQEAEAAIERVREALDVVGVLHPVAADRVLRALDGPVSDAGGSDGSVGGSGRADAAERLTAAEEGQVVTDPATLAVDDVIHIRWRDVDRDYRVRRTDCGVVTATYRDDGGIRRSAVLPLDRWGEHLGDPVVVTLVEKAAR